MRAVMADSCQTDIQDESYFVAIPTAELELHDALGLTKRRPM
jgi:hypothetical protein